METLMDDTMAPTDTSEMTSTSTSSPEHIITPTPNPCLSSMERLMAAMDTIALTDTSEMTSTSTSSPEHIITPTPNPCLSSMERLMAAMDTMALTDTSEMASTSTSIPEGDIINPNPHPNPNPNLSSLISHCFTSPEPAESCNKLSELIDDHPYLWLQVDEKTGRTVLHAAVAAGSNSVVAKVLAKLEAKHEQDEACLDTNPSSSSSSFSASPTALEFFDQVDKRHNLTALEMAMVTCNPYIIAHFAELPNSFWNPFHEFSNFEKWYESQEWKRQEECERQLRIRWPFFADRMRQKEWYQELERSWQTLNPDPDLKPLEFKPEEIFRVAVRSLDEAMFTEFVKDLATCATEKDPEFSIESILPSLLTSRDREGKSPLHVAVSTHTRCPLQRIIDIISDHFPGTFPIDKLYDFVWRTPLHWAAALGNVEAVRDLARDGRVNLNATFDNKFSWHHARVAGHENFLTRNQHIGALHLAAMHGHDEVVEALLSVDDCEGIDVNALTQRMTWPPAGYSGSDCGSGWTAFQLAALKGHVHTLQAFLQSDMLYDCGVTRTQYMKPPYTNGIPALHLAAAAGRPLAVKALLDSGRVDVFSVDKDGNTALHYATKYINLVEDFNNALDYVSLENVLENPLSAHTKPSSADLIACMEILVEAGLPMNLENKFGEAPSLEASVDDKVHEWWSLMKMEITQDQQRIVSPGSCDSSVHANPLQPDPLVVEDDPEEQDWLDWL